MLRLLVLAFVCGSLAAVGAAPVPKSVQEREALAKHYGTFTDPSGDSGYTADGAKLVIKLPKATGPMRIGSLPFPHTKRNVEGDFVLEVKVTYPLPEKVPALGAGTCAAGGLFIWGGEQSNVLFHRGHQPCGLADGTTRWSTNYFIEYNRGAKSMHHQNGTATMDAPPVHMRLTRKKGVVTPAYSYDGKEWKAMQSGAILELPDKVQVGVYAYRTAGEATAVTFEGFTVTPIEAPKSKE